MRALVVESSSLGSSGDGFATVVVGTGGIGIGGCAAGSTGSVGATKLLVGVVLPAGGTTIGAPVAGSISIGTIHSYWNYIVRRFSRDSASHRVAHSELKVKFSS